MSVYSIYLIRNDYSRTGWHTEDNANGSKVGAMAVLAARH